MGTVRALVHRLRLEGFESQEHLAKLIRDAGDGLGVCRKDLLSIDPSMYTFDVLGQILEKAARPTVMFFMRCFTCARSTQRTRDTLPNLRVGQSNHAAVSYTHLTLPTKLEV